MAKKNSFAKKNKNTLSKSFLKRLMISWFCSSVVVRGKSSSVFELGDCESLFSDVSFVVFTGDVGLWLTI